MSGGIASGVKWPLAAAAVQNASLSANTASAGFVAIASQAVTVSRAGSNLLVSFKAHVIAAPLTGDGILALSVNGTTWVPITSFGAGAALGLAVQGDFLFVGMAAGAVTVSVGLRLNGTGTPGVGGDSNRPALLLISEQAPPMIA